ncbi:MAG: hypothetical protein LQ346_005415 [Caloplaca aetnensis]|nr:MAG: hypothetical protein LQ346_005415 [Caloplaca aetnensis]
MRARRDRRESTIAASDGSQTETPSITVKQQSNATTIAASVRHSEKGAQSQRQRSVWTSSAARSQAQQNESPASSASGVAEKGPLLIPYGDVTTAFAIDISSSTSYDGILRQEKKAILDLSSHLSSEAKARARVLPWHEKADPPIETHQINELNPGWGTNPTVIISARDHQNLLRHCSLWFLLTDGEIGTREIQEFALGVGAKGLHGKACVVILFSARPSQPSNCNISVGQAVFAVAPDCAFLFHDVSTEEVYILQCKGCFRALLPSHQTDVVIDDSVGWKDIPRTSYDKLACIAVPKPRDVDHNAIILESGRIVHLDHLYHGTVGPDMAAEILDSDDNLKSILLAAQNHGKSREIENWVSKQRTSRKPAPFYMSRPDLDGSALRQVKTLVTAMKGTVYHPDLLEALQQNLRESHQRNWASFIRLVELNSDTVDRRNTVVNDALARVRLNRKSPSSPSMMSPVSPQRYSKSSRNADQPYASVYPPPESMFPLAGYPPLAPRLPHVELPVRTGQSDIQNPMSPVQGSPYGPPAPPALGARYSPNPAHILQPPSPKDPELSQLLYMKGYGLRSGPAAAQPFRGLCSLCGDGNSPLALLLKARPSDVETEGDFPTATSHSDIKFPLAMGNFPETDIISSFMSCEKCADFMRNIGTSPLDDSIKGAIPLVPLSQEMNRDSVLKEIDIALEQRFNTSILDQTFLSILYGKLDEVTTDDNGSKILADALRWQCRNLMPHIFLNATLSSSFDPSEQLVSRPLSMTMSATLLNLDSSGSLFQYPVDGFITLIKASIDLDLVSLSDDIVKKAVFQRLLFHFVEQQAVLREQEGDEAAEEELQRIFQQPPDMIFEALQGTYLLDESTHESFQRCEVAYECIRQDYGSAVCYFLRLMGSTPWAQWGPEEYFEAVRAEPEARWVFEKPWEGGDIVVL